MPARTLYFARLGFPHILDPKPVTQNGREIGDPRFSCNVHLDTVDPALIHQIKLDILAAYAEKWPTTLAHRPALPCTLDSAPETWTNKLPGYCRIPLVWGPRDFPEDANAKGYVLITGAKADSPPTVVELRANQPVPLSDRAKVYPGCEAHVSVGVFAYQVSASSPGIAAGLNGVALTGRDLGRFDSRPGLQQMFGNLPPEAPAPMATNTPPAPVPANAPYDPYAGAQQPPAQTYTF